MPFPRLHLRAGESTFKLLRVVLTSLSLCASIHAETYAAEVTLRWDYSASGAAGFVLYCGPSSRTYPTRVDVGNTDTYTMTTLTEGATSFCAVTAYDPAKTESVFSNEISVHVPYAAPVVSFDAIPASGKAPLSVTFTNSTTGQVSSWAWSFGDGGTSNSKNPTHVYGTPGNYTASLTATGAGGTRTSSKMISVTAQGGTSPAPGLVAAYAFNEGAGTTVADASGNGNTGTIDGASWTNQGRAGVALSFNGVNSMVKIPSSASLNLSAAMTLEAWIFPTAAQSGWRTIVQRDVDAYFLNASNRNGALVPAGGGTFDGAVSWVGGTASTPVNAWTHVALTYDGATLRLYVNGVHAASQAHTGGIQTNANQISVGGNVPWGEFFQGRIDEVRVYKRALSQAEIQTDMNTSVAPDTTLPSAAGLVAAYAFNEGAGTTVADASGNGNTGTIDGASWTNQGRAGVALSFNGVNSMVKIPSSASLNLSAAMTLEAWIFPTAAQSGWRTIVQRDVDAYFLNASNRNGALVPAGGGTFDGAVSWVGGTASTPVNAWTHVALTYDGATLRLYVNGVHAASQAHTGGIQTNANQISVGGNVPWGEFFQGRIDEVRVYKRALSQAEIQNDMNRAVAP